MLTIARHPNTWCLDAHLMCLHYEKDVPHSQVANVHYEHNYLNKLLIKQPTKTTIPITDIKINSQKERSLPNILLLYPYLEEKQYLIASQKVSLQVFCTP